jgi:transcription initiation factor TFIID subunit TAF12
MADERAAILQQQQQQQQQQHTANSSNHHSNSHHSNVASFMTSSKRPSVFGAISCKDNVCITVTDTLPSGPGNVFCNAQTSNCFACTMFTTVL